MAFTTPSNGGTEAVSPSGDPAPTIEEEISPEPAPSEAAETPGTVPAPADPVDPKPLQAEETRPAIPVVPEMPTESSPPDLPDAALAQNEPAPSIAPAPESAVTPEPVAPPPPPPTQAAVAPPMVEPPAPAPPSAKPLPSEELKIDQEGDGILAKPRGTLLKFLLAKSWEERGQYVQYPDRTLGEMEDYYADRDDGPIAVTSVTYQNSERVPDGTRIFYVFHVVTEEVPEGFPVSVEETSDGLKVDWQSCVEFMDLHLPAFLASYRPDAEDFHLVLRRSHYFDDSLPNLDKMVAFRVEPPIPGYEGYAFLPKGSPLTEGKYEYLLDWGSVSYLVARLKWQQTKSGAQYVVIDDVVQGNWRTDGREITGTSGN